MRRQLAETLKASGLFDAQWYCATYADVASSGLSAWEHFVQQGFEQGRAPGPGFSPAQYLSINADVAASDFQALEHYLLFGKNEGRALEHVSLWPEQPVPDGLPAWVKQGSSAPPARGQRILYVLSIQSGGTPQTNQDLMLALQGKAECLVLRCAGHELTLYFFHDGIYVPLASHQLQQPIEPFPHALPEFDLVVERWLAQYRVTMVHIRHLAWQGLGVIALADRLDVPVVCSFHDYYTVCPSVKLLDENLQFCGGRCTASRGECPHELWSAEQMPALKHENIYVWQQQFAGALVLCDGFVTTTAAARELILSIFPALAGMPFDVVPHGRDFTELNTLAERPAPGGELRVLVPGHLAVAKGSQVLLELAQNPALGHVQWHVLGSLSGARDAGVPDNLIIHGAYARDDFASLVAQIRPHVGAVLSVWPETWCHTLTELWSVGVPVLGFDIGAVGERLTATGAGWPISPLSADAAAQALIQAAKPDEWRRVMKHVEGWQKEGQVSCQRMADSYWQLYETVLSRRHGKA